MQRTACLCGKTEATSFGVKDELELVQCTCGIVRRAELDPQDYTAQYMSGFYHNENIQTVVGKTIKDRYGHDFDLARNRLRELFNAVPMVVPIHRMNGDGTRRPAVLLDVGCGNGAFVQAALEHGFDAYGIDLYLPASTDCAVGIRGRLEVSTLADCRFTRRTVDVLVMNDVIEHVPDPVALLKQAAGIVKRDGMVVIDTPDFDELTLDNHHVKPREHIWYVSPRLWLEMFAEAGLVCKAIRNPIAGKVVFYLQDDQRELDVTVRGPTGLGDVHWILLKMGALKAAEAPCKLTLAIPGNGDPQMIMRAKGFLDLVPFIDETKMEAGAPVIIDAGADDVSLPSYTWIANGHLERGSRIEDWNEYLPVDYHYPVDIPAAATRWAKQIQNHVKGPLVLYYGSSKAWNHAVTAGKGWTIADWAALTAELEQAGIMPVLIGKHWDSDYSAEFNEKCDAPFLDLTGNTTEAQALALMQEADAVIGMCSGLTILGVHLRTPSIVFWPEVGAGLNSLMEFNREFARDWVDPELVAEGKYAPLTLGKFGVTDIVEQLKNWGVL